ncbi:hypothetical protein [Capnocytophaga catalasegens]|uniref:DUF4355 domain-containing protein n=1 Tax=Capnocytophaga catalasegens TaxID=1004260 RepID=A0AAV5ATF1_9FLAO|nr:hypothetical protein [Capnocytophaga catalasegens]GIZ15506.1 hypothetical protein RCZ03_15060 [Capnocytophaga catalasegens]GJM49849.1 hypothetical protein RCZ15_08240 [Capnocytophaga catalasegens]GJM54021.1 hypothetical protein RCZ16_23370 [Capnocytophaga catalasegens]
MYQKLVELLGTKFPQARKDGLQQLARSYALQVADETEAQALIDKLTSDKVTEFIKDWRKEVDSEVTKGVNSFKERQNGGGVQQPTPTQTPQTDNNDMATLIANTVSQAIKPLQKELETLKAGRTIETRKQTFEAALKDIPEALKSSVLKTFDRLQFVDDEDFNTFVTETQAELAKAQQEAVNSGLRGFPHPTNSSSQSINKEIKGEIAEWAKSNAQKENNV